MQPPSGLPVFLGQFEHNVDQKGRLAIPARFRELLGAGLVATRGFERCIVVYPLPIWTQVAERLAALPQTRSANRRLNRAAFANAFSLELDQQGRAILPEALRDWAGIDGEVVVVGLLNYFEIWSRARWREESAHLGEQAWQLAEELDPPLLK